MCRDHCQAQANEITIRERTAHFRRDPVCRRFARYYRGDSTGAALGKAVKAECARAKALAELGIPSEGAGEAQAQWTEHLDREGARRKRASDRAIQINEGWQNRAAIDRNTRATQHELQDTRDAIKDQTDAIENLNRSLDPGVGSRYRSPHSRYSRY